MIEEQKRLFYEEDREYILHEIKTKIDYFEQARALDRCLRRPVSEVEFAAIIHGLVPGNDNDLLINILQITIERFKEKWPDARVLESRKVHDLRIEKKDD